MENQITLDKISRCFIAACPFMDKKVAFFIACQAALETGWFASDVYRECNNLFGMRMPKQRITIAFESHLNHASYHVVFDSFVDYLLWLVNYGFNQFDLKDIDRFVSKLRKSPFNPSDKYVDTILKIYKTYYHD